MIKISIKRLSVWVNSFLIGTVNIFQLIQLLLQHQLPVLYLGVSGNVQGRAQYCQPLLLRNSSLLP